MTHPLRLSQDVVFVKQVEPQPGMCHNLFMVCDGHQGVDAAAFTAQVLPQMLGARLPGHLPDWQDPKGEWVTPGSLPVTRC